MTDAAAVSARGIHKAFGDRQVLSGVDIELAPGTITAVLGPSGCGKTTLLRILAGFEDPDAGTVSIAGQTVAGEGPTVPVHRRRVGLMPQEGALFPHLSVGENVAFGLGRDGRTGWGRDGRTGLGRDGRTGLGRDGRKESAAQVAHWLEVVGLAGLADARPHEISGGQQQRVALARALAARPRVLLLDEPFAALDAGLRVRVREDIATILRDTATTALLVTHDQAEALSLADSVALLMGGVVTRHGTPADLYDRPGSLANARFLGSTVEIAATVHAGLARTSLGPLRTRDGVADGPAVVVLRPEQLRFGTGASGTAARVTARRFYGADTVVHVELADGTRLQLRSPVPTALEDGAAVTVEVAGDVLAYPSPPGGQRVPLGETGG
ncbi:ABC transporter ATP-binding protein [Mycolicibacterium vaccae]|uniref:ABC transporter--like protein n=1 Tax=Mycolicibacterium vaccae ATCC 25954 TaxID=1194972 RepID=K0UD76_MYCVA|nr:ABC transporter ATP-binding protein [Mycolicibacterium vaccae]ANI40135.1 ABC transporter [Mycolicibacterium vaccae 95051]EJZ05232.1 ABC transporter--like protein [Mycolicibacterium vaccae ATCC 25954]MCV7060126.1 ABC transporter ATP-binding protein [Mycolicibacterium vaccae]